MQNHLLPRRSRSRGFSLFEVVLAVGVLSVSILALLGLFGPTMSSVRDVVDNNEANGVRTRLNAALMSDEIYKAIGLDADGDISTRFSTFAGYLTDPTVADGEETGPEPDVLLFFWNERPNLDSPFVLKYATDTADFEITEAEGSAFVVTLEQGMQGGDQPYDFEKVDEQGHFPILVSIYAVPPSDFTSKDKAAFKTWVTTVDPLFTYTTAKLR